MTNNKENNNLEEIDLGYLYKSANRYLTKIGLNFYNLLMFLKRYALVIIGIFVVGSVLGYFIDKNKAVVMRHDIIVVPNFHSVDYLYEYLPKISFLEEVNHNSNSSIENHIDHIEIKPIENIYNLFKDNQAIMLPLSKIVGEKGGKIMDITNAESIIRNYKFHMISIYTVGQENTTEIVDKIFEKLNSNDYYIQNQNIAKVQNQIKKSEIERSLQQINEIIYSIGKGEKLLDPKGISINTFSGIDDIFKRKDKILDDLLEIKQEIIEQENIVYITERMMNNLVEESIWKQNIFSIPFYLLSIFFSIIILLNFIRKFKAIKEKGLN